jgi:uncharacterized membrane protein YuzA (DUF378 family)
MDKSYMMKKLYMVGVVLLIIGGFNAGLWALTGKDLITSFFGRRSLLTNALFLAMGVTALALAFCRDFYLPFLGETVMPCSVLPPQTPEGADTEVNVRVHPGAKVMYWATESKDAVVSGLQSWRNAYKGFQNAGVVIADAEGNAELAVRSPQAYTVPTKGKLNPHVHYRECGDDGMMKRVETAFLKAAGDDEGFIDVFESVEPAPPMIVPRDAIAEINQVAKQTAAQSLMAESGAFDEFNKKSRGADL